MEHIRQWGRLGFCSLSLLLTTCLLSACEGTTELLPQEEVVEEETSEIVPARPIYENLIPIVLTYPRVGAIQYVFDEANGRLVLRFEDDSPKQILWILDQKPLPEDLSSGAFLEHCVAGTANFLRQTWDQSVVLTSSAQSSELFACGDSINRPLNPAQVVVLCTKEDSKCPVPWEAKRDYYWLVLGYDEQFKLRAASPVGQFVLR
jgi:hypothetical protein